MSTTQPDMAPELNALCLEYKAAKEALDAASAAERALRTRIEREIFQRGAEGQLWKGTERRHIVNGIQIKHEGKLNYSFTSRAALDAVLDEIENMSPEGKFLVDKLVKFTPALSVSNYDEAPPEIKAKIDAVLVTKQGSPTLSIEWPKG